MIGLGVLGQLTVQLLRAAGCRVLGDGPRSGPRRARRRARSARTRAATSPSGRDALTGGFGADAVDRHRGDGVERPDARRRRRPAGRKGRVVIVGDVGLELRRSDLYEKELDVLMSTSYGPGRYDPVYELEGQRLPDRLRALDGEPEHGGVPAPARDGRARPRRAPAGAVRRSTTPRRAYAALERRAEAAARAALLSGAGGGRRGGASRSRTRRARSPGRIGVALVGAGSFAQGSHVPNLLEAARPLPDPRRREPHRRDREGRRRARRGGVRDDRSRRGARRPGDRPRPDRDAARPARGAGAARRCEAGKHVFVEKPLALDRGRARARSRRFYADRADGPLLMTGFNRRFSPAIARAARAARGTHDAARRRLPHERRLSSRSTTGCTGPRAAAATSARPVTSTTSSTSLVGGAEVERVSRAGDPRRRHRARGERQLRRDDSLRRRLGLHADVHGARPPRPSEGAARGLRGRRRPHARRLQVAARSPAAAAAGAARRSTRAISRSSRRWRPPSATAARGRSRWRSRRARCGSPSPSRSDRPMTEPTYSFVIPVHDEEASASRALSPARRAPRQARRGRRGDPRRRRQPRRELCDHARREPTDRAFKLVRLSRNFGHQLAITAGLDLARRRCDHRHGRRPPGSAGGRARVERWREGYDVVYGVRGSARRVVQASAGTCLLRAAPADDGRRRPGGRRRLPTRRSQALDAFRRCARTTATSAACSAGSASARPASRTTVRRASRGGASTRSER